jgi:hypothetical protein
MAEAKRCMRHPETETMLSCGRCGDPICPRCMVHTHVGARCPACAQVKKVPTYDVSPKFLSRAVVTSVLVSVACAVLFILLYRPLIFRVSFLAVLVMVGIGYAIGEATSVAANRRRGRTLQYTVAFGIIIAGVLVILFVAPLTIWVFVGIILAFFVGLSRVT